MLKGKYVYLRMLDSEDWELTYKWHNDVDIQRMTCGPIRVVSKDIEKAWVNKVASNNQKDLFLAICDIVSDKMIGFLSLNNINYHFQSCHWGGIVIGDKEFQDGTMYIEASLLILDYAFNQLNMHRVTGACLKEHIMSRSQAYALYYEQEGIQRDAVQKNGKFYDVCTYALLRDSYYSHRASNDYEMSAIIRRLVRYSKQIKCKN
jgi:RimJ/RimL family protein N-acetyltransferase